MVESKKRIIGGGASILLDSLRIGAALIVLILHASGQWITASPSTLDQLSKIAHAAVVVFFVLSGYLIAYTTTSNNRGPTQYAVARLSRLYSVVLPALLVTEVIEIIVNISNPTIAAQYTRGSSWPRYILSAFFCNEISFFSSSPPINGPLWSLSYEFWYYAIFGIWFFKSSSLKSLLFLLAVCLVVGPKILALMPVWLFGFFAYRLPNPLQSTTKAWGLVFLLLFIAALASIYLPAFPFVLGVKPFFYANRFVTDWVIGIFVALAIWCLPLVEYPQNSAWVQPIRVIADLSFPIYVLHYPLLIAWHALFGVRVDDVLQLSEAIMAVILIAVVIGLVLERQRGVWIRLFKWLITYVSAQYKQLSRYPTRAKVS